ncbi:sodium solute symporter [Aureococcus anophagefferens]|uniref:Sodium solute symporter n=1 Tax=Aureococcus anophagefferens TaxID=44056 RepID=A0ABR1G5J8_AURAN
MIEKARPTSADAHFTVGASLGMLPFMLPPAEARRRSRPHDEVVFAAPAAPGTMSGALDEALAAIHTATSLLSELRCDGEVSGDHEGGADADAAPAAPPRGADELRGLLEQLSGVSVQVLLSATSPGSTVLVAKDEDDSSDDDGDELVMTELDPAEAAATLGLAAPAVDGGGDDGLSSDDEPLQSAPVTLGSADIAKLKAVNAGRAAPRRAPAAIACEYVAYADEILDFLRGGHAAFAHLFDKSLRRAHGARRATVEARAGNETLPRDFNVKARRAALDGAAPPAGESAPAAAAARPAYSPLHRPEVPPRSRGSMRPTTPRASRARGGTAPPGPRGRAGQRRRGARAPRGLRARALPRAPRPLRVVGLRLPGGGGAAPPRADGPPRSVADALRVDDVAAPATAPVTAASFAAWLGSPRKVAAAAVFGLNGSVAGALLEAPLAQLGRDLGLEARPNFAGELEAAWASPDRAALGLRARGRHPPRAPRRARHAVLSAWYSIALSFFASGMGAWIVYGTTEMGATRPISWWGVIGYSTASAFPAVLLCWLGPRIKTVVGAASGFSATDFALSRYGRLMHLHVCCISCFYMYIYMSRIDVHRQRLRHVGRQVRRRRRLRALHDEDRHLRGALHLAYTALAGLPASILTDKFQGVVITCVVIMLLVATTTLKSNEVSKQEYDDATGWFSKGFEALVTLWIAICSAELFNQGNWQLASGRAVRQGHEDRLPRRRRPRDARHVVLRRHGHHRVRRDAKSYDTWQKLAYLSFFDLLRNLPRFWHYVTLALLTTLAASSLDTLQNGIASVLSRDLLKQKLNTNWSRLVVVGFNIAAIIQASDRFEVVPLFLVADLVCATAVFPLFLGLWTDDLVVGPLTIRRRTELGAFLGALAGIAAVMVNGEINDVNKAVNPYTGKVYDKSAFAYFWGINSKSGRQPPERALCGTKLMVTFIVVPLVSAAATVIFSYVDVYVGGDKAKQPFIIVADDDKKSPDEELTN